MDPAIRALGGHYSQYAQCVLLAARQAGFETALVVNRGIVPPYGQCTQ